MPESLGCTVRVIYILTTILSFSVANLLHPNSVSTIISSSNSSSNSTLSVSLFIIIIINIIINIIIIIIDI